MCKRIAIISFVFIVGIVAGTFITVNASSLGSVVDEAQSFYEQIKPYEGSDASFGDSNNSGNDSNQSDTQEIDTIWNQDNATEGGGWTWNNNNLDTSDTTQIGLPDDFSREEKGRYEAVKRHFRTPQQLANEIIKDTEVVNALFDPNDGLYNKKIIRNTTVSGMGGQDGSTKKYIQDLNKLETILNQSNSLTEAHQKKVELMSNESDDRDGVDGRTRIDATLSAAEEAQENVATDSQSIRFIKRFTDEKGEQNQSGEAVPRRNNKPDSHGDLLYERKREADGGSPSSPQQQTNLIEYLAENNPLSLCNYWPGPTWTCPFMGMIEKITQETLEIALDKIPFCELINAARKAQAVASTVQSAYSSAQTMQGNISDLNPSEMTNSYEQLEEGADNVESTIDQAQDLKSELDATQEAVKGFADATKDLREERNNKGGGVKQAADATAALPKIITIAKIYTRPLCTDCNDKNMKILSAIKDQSRIKARILKEGTEKRKSGIKDAVVKHNIPFRGDVYRSVQGVQEREEPYTWFAFYRSPRSNFCSLLTVTNAVGGEVTESDTQTINAPYAAAVNSYNVGCKPEKTRTIKNWRRGYNNGGSFGNKGTCKVKKPGPILVNTAMPSRLSGQITNGLKTMAKDMNRTVRFPGLSSAQKRLGKSPVKSDSPVVKRAKFRQKGAAKGLLKIINDHKNDTGPFVMPVNDPHGGSFAPFKGYAPSKINKNDFDTSAIEESDTITFPPEGGDTESITKFVETDIDTDDTVVVKSKSDAMARIIDNTLKETKFKTPPMHGTPLAYMHKVLQQLRYSKGKGDVFRAVQTIQKYMQDREQGRLKDKKDKKETDTPEMIETFYKIIDLTNKFPWISPKVTKDQLTKRLKKAPKIKQLQIMVKMVKRRIKNTVNFVNSLFGCGAKTAWETLVDETTQDDDDRSISQTCNATISEEIQGDNDGVPHDYDDDKVPAFDLTTAECAARFGDIQADTQVNEVKKKDDEWKENCKLDNCPFTYNPLQIDSDNDGIGNLCDRFITIPNSSGSDNNGLGGGGGMIGLVGVFDGQQSLSPGLGIDQDDIDMDGVKNDKENKDKIATKNCKYYPEDGERTISFHDHRYIDPLMPTNIEHNVLDGSISSFERPFDRLFYPPDLYEEYTDNERPETIKISKERLSDTSDMHPVEDGALIPFMLDKSINAYGIEITGNNLQNINNIEVYEASGLDKISKNNEFSPNTHPGADVQSWVTETRIDVRNELYNSINGSGDNTNLVYSGSLTGGYWFNETGSVDRDNGVEGKKWVLVIRATEPFEIGVIRLRTKKLIDPVVTDKIDTSTGKTVVHKGSIHNPPCYSFKAMPPNAKNVQQLIAALQPVPPITIDSEASISGGGSGDGRGTFKYHTTPDDGCPCLRTQSWHRTHDTERYYSIPDDVQEEIEEDQDNQASTSRNTSPTNNTINRNDGSTNNNGTANNTNRSNDTDSTSSIFDNSDTENGDEDDENKNNDDDNYDPVF